MRGLVLDGVRQVSYRSDLPEPVIVDPSDVVVGVHRAGLCGSDLHPYEGREAVRFGVIPGHEVVGEVVAVGSGVARFRPGDRVLVPFSTSCGECQACRTGLSARCRLGSLFGYGPADDPATPALDGAQAEFVRVPLADGTLVPVPEGMPDGDAVLLTDNLPTGWYAAERAHVAAGDTVAVVGLGSVGLCAAASAFALGAGSVLAIDPVEQRRRRAEELGATVAHPDDAADAIGTLTADAGGAASVIEAAGNPAAQALAYSLVRPGGTLSIIAVQTYERFGFTAGQAYDANLTVRVGRAPVRSVLDRLLARLECGELVVPGDLILTHPQTPLADGPEAYRRFAARQAGIVKVAFVP